MQRDGSPDWPMHRVTASTTSLPLRDSITPCIVTSVPYNVAIVYPSGYTDHVPWPVYAAKARVWAKEMARVLMVGGRVWLNVQQTVPKIVGDVGGERINLGFLWMDALAKAGLKYRDTLFWIQDSFDGACAWGSWRQPSAPNLRGAGEMILLYYKGVWARPIRPVWRGKPQPRVELGGDWVDLTRNVWKINPANGKDAPAAFPIELPARAIRLSTWPNELVVDPFAGRGTTGWAAEQLGRQSVMVDLGW
jgi:DNA modification methylase